MLLDLAPSDCTEWDKALYVYETLAQLVDYEEDEEGIATERIASDGSWDHGRDWSRTIYGPLVHHRAVCTGYTKAAQYLLQQLGVECLHLSGARGTRHCWILARLDGAYSFMDVTWANATSKERPGVRYVAHDYFGLTYADLAELPTMRSPPWCPCRRRRPTATTGSSARTDSPIRSTPHGSTAPSSVPLPRTPDTLSSSSQTMTCAIRPRRISPDTMASSASSGVWES